RTNVATEDAVRCEGGVQIARMDNGRLNTERPNLATQCLYQTVQREFRSAVVWNEGQADKSTDRTDHHDVAGGPLPHGRKDRTDHPRRSKEIRIEMPLGLVVFRVLERPCQSHASACDQAIQSRLAPQHVCDGRIYRALLGDVERKMCPLRGGTRC